MGCLFQAVFSWAKPAMDGIKDWLAWAGPRRPSRRALPVHAVTDLLADGVIAGVGAVLVFLPQIVLLFLFLGILEDSGYMTRAAFIVDRPLRAVGLSGRAFIPLLSSFACAIPGIMATRTISDRRERLLTMLVAPLMTCSARLPVYCADHRRLRARPAAVRARSAFRARRCSRSTPPGSSWRRSRPS